MKRYTKKAYLRCRIENLNAGKGSSEASSWDGFIPFWVVLLKDSLWDAKRSQSNRDLRANEGVNTSCLYLVLRWPLGSEEYLTLEEEWGRDNEKLMGH